MNIPALQDRCVVIVGATTGLGLSATRACLAAGARVVGFSRSEDSVERARAKLGSEARLFAADAADPASAARAIEVARATFGRCDALYHVAGGSGRSAGDGPLHELTDSGIDATLRQNLASVMYSNRAAVRSFLARGVAGS